MKLAWRNLSHDRLRFAVTIAGIAFATFLMIFQGSLLAGFVRASSKVIEASDADIWITPRGTSCFEFVSTVPIRFRDLAMGVDGVTDVKRIVTGFANWQKSSGARLTVLIISSDDISPRFPQPRFDDSGSAAIPRAVVVDTSNLQTLGVDRLPTEVEINEQFASVPRSVNDFGSFMGSPYVFTSYAERSRYISLNPELVTYLLVRVNDGKNVQGIKRQLSARMPEVDVWTRDEFAANAATYWVAQTGAGGALMTAAVLGFIVGLVVVSQTIYATTMEHIEEFATLKALGASRWFIWKIVLTQALASGVMGSLVGIVLAYPAMQLTRRSISWVYTPWPLPIIMVFISLLMCALAAVVSIRKAVSIEPGRVFRA
jgi:putative ABC transport system permease protein